MGVQGRQCTYAYGFTKQRGRIAMTSWQAPWLESRHTYMRLYQFPIPVLFEPLSGGLNALAWALREWEGCPLRHRNARDANRLVPQFLLVYA